MKLEQQVVSLELAKKLKELGVKQESFFQWREGGVLGGQRPKSSEILPTKRPPSYGAANEAHSFYSAFTVAELGEMLPMCIEEEGKSFLLHCVKTNNYWVVKYDNRNWNCSIPVFTDDTEADARAKMLIYLLENKLITL